MWTGEATEASIFPSYVQYQIRSQTDQTYKIKMSSQTNILPPEMVEKIIQYFTSIQDVTNFSLALVGTRHEKFVMEDFLKPQLKIFASLDLNLKESLKNHPQNLWRQIQNAGLITHFNFVGLTCLRSNLVLSIRGEYGRFSPFTCPHNKGRALQRLHYSTTKHKYL